MRNNSTTMKIGSCVICIVLSAGCSEKPQAESAGRTLHDSSTVASVADDESVDSAEASTASIRQDTVLAEQVAIIGATEDVPDYLFGRITSVALDALGNIYIADAIGSDVRAFDFHGKLLGRIGREGGGPGEFSSLADLTFDPSGRLWVRDSRRITVFARRQSSVLADSPVHTIPTPRGNTSSRRARTNGVLLYYPDGRFRDPARYFYVVYDSTGPTGDTVHVPPLRNLNFLGPAFVRLGPTDGRMIEGVTRAPFEPTASWDITPRGTIVASPGDAYELVEVGEKRDTIHRLTMDVPAAHPSPREMRDSSAAFRQRLASIPVALDRVIGMSQVAREGKLPATLPAIFAVHATEAQTWLRRWASGETTVFDVIDRTGRPLYTVLIPASLSYDPPPFVSPRLVAGVVRDRTTDVDRVAVFRIPRP